MCVWMQSLVCVDRHREPRTEPVCLHRRTEPHTEPVCVDRRAEPQPHTILPLPSTGWQRPIGCLIFTDYSPQKCPMISGSFAETDLQLIRQVSYGKDALDASSLQVIFRKRAL